MVFGSGRTSVYFVFDPVTPLRLWLNAEYLVSQPGVEKKYRRRSLAYKRNNSIPELKWWQYVRARVR